MLAGALFALLLAPSPLSAQEGRAVVRDVPPRASKAAPPAPAPAAAKPAAAPKPKAKPRAKLPKPRTAPTAGRETLWKPVGSSLLFYVDGAPTIELGNGVWDEEKDGTIDRRTARGGVSKDRRFAWHWVKLEKIRKGRVDETLNWASTLSYYGSSGKSLWDDEGAEAPPGREPLLMSDDGETAVVFGRQGPKWRMTAYSFTGNPLLLAELGDRIEDARITPKGRYALVAWGPMDRPLVCSFFDLQTRAQRDVAAATLPPLEQLVLGDDGALSYHGKIVLRLKP